MRRLAGLLLLGSIPFALLVPAASARPSLPCDYWVHGCDVTAYVCDAIDCGII